LVNIIIKRSSQRTTSNNNIGETLFYGECGTEGENKIYNKTGAQFLLENDSRKSGREPTEKPNNKTRKKIRGKFKASTGEVN